jgi:predicted NBD/HSP70 family sugar kinase
MTLNLGTVREGGPANAAWSARVNRAQVLRLVLDRGTISRPELARLTGLTTGTISNAVRDLIQLRLLQVTGSTVPRRQAEAGAPARLLALDRDWYRVLAVHQGVSRLSVAATDISGRLRVRRSLPLDANEGWEATADRVAASLRELVVESGWEERQVPGVGVGAVGLVDPSSGAVREAPNVGWKDAGLRQRLEQALPWPVVVSNNVHAMALGEERLGELDSGLGIYVYVGTGIGSGIIFAGQLLGGAHGAAGELGHLAVPGGQTCSCGKTGCLETVAAEPAIAKRASGAIPGLADGLPARLDDLTSGHHKAVVGRLVERVLGGDGRAVGLVAEAGRSLGQALSQVTEILDPGVIIVNGIIVEAGDLFLQPLSEALHAHAFSLRGRHVEVRPATFGREAGLVGAATLAMDEFIYRPEAEILSRLAAPAPAGPRRPYRVSIER